MNNKCPCLHIHFDASQGVANTTEKFNIWNFVINFPYFFLFSFVSGIPSSWGVWVDYSLNKKCLIIEWYLNVFILLTNFMFIFYFYLLLEEFSFYYPQILSYWAILRTYAGYFMVFQGFPANIVYVAFPVMHIDINIQF